MKAIVIDGTVEEIIQVINTVQPLTAGTMLTVPQESGAGPKSQAQRGDGDKKYVDLEFARRVLVRRPLSEPVKAVLKALYDANPKYVTTTVLRDVVGYQSGHQLAGLMGAFGRRIANTAGNDDKARFFDVQWNDDDHAWEYFLPDTVREALEQEHLV